MTDLDRKIAELKGCKFEGIKVSIPWLAGKTIGVIESHMNDEEYGLNWSDSDAKAFELVDEACNASPSPHSFNLLFHCEEPKESRWTSLFLIGALRSTGWGETRPEAICRAYIALKEWEGKK